MTQFLKKLRAWLAKLAFWRKRASDADPKPEAEPAPIAAVDAAKRKPRDKPSDEPETPAPRPGMLARLKQWLSFRRKQKEAEAEPDAEVADAKKTRAKAAEEPEIPEPKPGLLARLKRSLAFRRKPVETEAEPDAEAIPERKRKDSTPEEAEIPEPPPGIFARLKRCFSFRRKPAETEAGAADDKTQVIEKTKNRSEPTAAEGEEEAPQPSRLKRLLTRLRSKWVWIPALSLTFLGLASWIAVFMMQATHEKERLQTELKAAKKMLERKTAVAAPAPVPPPRPAAPAKPEEKIDPAFKIVGHIPAPQPEDESGINASDCVVKDKASVAENLKHCITSFNEAVAAAPKKPK